MNATHFITMQEVRRDVPGFLKRIASGQRLTVVYHSKPLVTVTNADLENPRTDTSQIQEFLAIAAAARKSATSAAKVDQAKSYKDQYHNHLAKKYGVS